MILDKFKLDGQAAIVTGAARGLGQAMAIGLAEAGADVFLVDVLETAETKKKIEKVGRRGVSINAYLSSKDCIDRIINTTLEELSKINILVNNDGIIRRAPITEFSEKDWDDVMNVNIRLFSSSAKQLHGFSSSKVKAARSSILPLCFPSGGHTRPVIYRLKERRDGADQIVGQRAGSL